MEDQPNGSSMTEADLVASRVAGALKRLVPDVATVTNHGGVEVFVPPEQLSAAGLILRDELRFAYLSMVTAVDWPDRLEVVYLAYSLTENPSVGVFLKANLPREPLASCPTLTTVWPGAEFQEREVYDLMGINFVGHPDMTRILTEDNFPGHPLRKDFSIEPDYVLMRHLRYGADGQDAPPHEADQTRGARADER